MRSWNSARASRGSAGRREESAPPVGGNKLAPVQILGRSPGAVRYGRHFKPIRRDRRTPRRLERRDRGMRTGTRRGAALPIGTSREKYARSAQKAGVLDDVTSRCLPSRASRRASKRSGSKERHSLGDERYCVWLPVGAAPSLREVSIQQTRDLKRPAFARHRRSPYLR